MVQFQYLKAFGGFSVNDIQKAKIFYTEVLGMEVSEVKGMLYLLVATDAKILVYQKPNHVPATFTILNFSVENIDKAVNDLINKGIEFEQYNEGDFVTDKKGIFRYENTKIAWFKDPAGNILSVIED